MIYQEGGIVLTDLDYDNWSKDLGQQYNVSGRVIRHIRNCFKGKYPELDLHKFKQMVINDSKGQIVDINRSNKPLMIMVIHSLTLEVTGLGKSKKILNSLEPRLPLVLGAIDKLGFRHSIINFTKRMTPEQFKEIIADIPDPLPDRGESK